MVYRIGLTGGIGSGKSTVASMFKRLGVPVIDADQVARAVVEPGTDALSRLEIHFGPSVLSEGQLDRRRLREIIFSDEAARYWVENLLHPYIQAEMLRRADQEAYPYVVMEVPLLLEAGYQNLVDRILVIDAPVSLQIDRVVSRDQVTSDQVATIIKTQIDAETRIQQADDVLENCGNLGDLERQVERLHQDYLGKARTQD
jgi:dephospho-CoA kinase